MIQRIQTLWLLLAAFISGALFISPLYKYSVGSTSVVNDTATTGTDTVNTAVANGMAGAEVLLKATNFYPLLLVAAVMTILPLIAIFSFGNRKKQRGMAIGSIFACMGFLGVMMMKIASIRKEVTGITNDDYVIPGALLPVIAIVFLILAIRGIGKDEKLVRSMDRLR